MDDLSNFDAILIKFGLGELSPGQLEVFHYFLDKCPCFMVEFSRSIIAGKETDEHTFCERKKTGNLSEDEKALYDELNEVYQEYLSEDQSQI